MSNLAGKSYAMTVISPMAATWINRIVFGIFRCIPDQASTLENLNIIHFARWSPLPADRWPGTPAGTRTKLGYQLFASNFNGTWDQYLDDFSDSLGFGTDLLWYQGIGYPKSVPSTPFKTYIDHNFIDNNYYYNATPQASSRDINNALLVRQALQSLERELDCLEGDTSLQDNDRDQKFQVVFCRVMGVLQNGLASLGNAPLASLETLKTNQQKRQLITALEAHILADAELAPPSPSGPPPAKS